MLSSIGLEPLISLQPMLYFGFYLFFLLLFFFYRVYLAFFALFFGFALFSIGLEPLISLQSMVHFGFHVFVSASLLFLLCLPGVLPSFLSDLCCLLSVLNR